MANVNLGSVYFTAELDLTSFKSGIKAMQSELEKLEKGVSSSVGAATKSVGDSLANIGESLTSFGKKATIALTVPLTMFGKSAIELANEIEVKWKEVQKVYGSTADAFVEDVAMLEEAVTNVATKFGSTKIEVLEVTSALAAMGYEGEELVTLLNQIYEYATTGQMDLNLAMESGVTISKVYGKTGQELTDTFAMLNKVENSTGASMEDLAIGINIAGSVAKTTGVSIDELSVFMATLRERGVDAGEAANGLKTILTRVFKVTEEAAPIYKKYGISIEDVTEKTGWHTVAVGRNQKALDEYNKKIAATEKQIYEYKVGIRGINMSDEERAEKIEELNKLMGLYTEELKKNGGEMKEVYGTYTVSNGALRDADDILRDIAKSWDKMTDKERLAVAESNAHLYQRNKFIAIMEDLNSETSTYEKTLDSLADTEDNLATYEKEMAVFLDTNKTKMAQAKIAIDDVKIAIGGILSDALIPLLENLKDLAKSFTELDPKVQSAITGFGVLLALLGPFLLVLGEIAKLLSGKGAIAAGFNVLKSAVVGLAGALGITVTDLLGWVAIIIGVIALLYVAWNKNWLGMRDTVGKFIEGVSNWLGTALPAWLKAHAEFLTGIVEFMTKVINWILANVIKLLAQHFGGLAVAAATVASAIIKTIADFITFVGKACQTFLKYTKDLWVGVAKGISTAIGSILLVIKNFIKIVNGVLTGNWREILKGMVGALIAAGNALFSIFQVIAQGFASIILGGLSLLIEGINKVLKSELIKKALDAMGIGAVKIEAPKIEKVKMPSPEEIAAELFFGIGEVTLDLSDIEEASNNVGNAVDSVISAFQEINFDSFKEDVHSFADSLVENAKKLSEGLESLGDLQIKFDSDSFKATILGVADSLVEKFGEAKEIIDSIELEKINPNLAMIPPVVEEVTNNVFNVDIGMYAGSEIEKRQIAKELADALNNYNLIEGVITG